MIARRGSVYLAVIATVSAVTVLSLTGVAIRKSFNDRARIGVQSSEAHRLARSAAELAVHSGVTESDRFREQAAVGTLFTDLQVNNGKISATISDADTGGRVEITTDRYRVETDARVRDARSRLAFTLIGTEPELTTLVRDLGAIAYWPLDEATGSSTAFDVIGGFDGTYNDPDRAGVDTHEHGNSSPQNDWITHRTEVPHDDAFLIDEGTIAFWVCWDAFPLPGIQMAAVSKETPSGRDSASFRVVLESAGKISATITDQDDAGGTAEANGAITAGQWHHVVVTWRNQLCLFVDGVEVDKNSGVKVGLAAESGNKGIEANVGPWMFGVRNKTVLFQTPAYPTFGSVARVAIFDSELSQSDIEDLYEASSLPGPMDIEPDSFVRVVD